MEHSTGKVIDIQGSDFFPLLLRISTLSENERIDEFTPAMFCSDRGKIRSFFWIKKLSDDHYQILCFDTNDFIQSKTTSEILEYFRFQEKFETRLISQDFYPSFEEKSEKVWFNKNQSFYLQNNPDPTFHSKRISLGFPWAGSEFIGETQNPLDLGFSELLKKKVGCYPGQEVFEKTLSLSEPAKRLCIFEFQKKISFSTPQDLYVENQKSGILTSYDPESGHGLGVISKVFTKKNHVFRTQNTEAIIKQEVQFEF